MNDRTKKLLEERGSRYGNFDDLAIISQSLKDRWYLDKNANFEEPTEAMNEAMEMVLHKLARVINGDRYYLDNIDDMIGYLELYREEILNNSINTTKEEEKSSESEYWITKAIIDVDDEGNFIILNKEDLEPEVIREIEKVLSILN